MTADSLPSQAHQPIQIELVEVGTVSPLSKQVREKWDSAEAEASRDHSLESLLARLTAADEKRQVRKLHLPLGLLCESRRQALVERHTYCISRAYFCKYPQALLLKAGFVSS